MIIILLFFLGLIGVNCNLPPGAEKCKFGDNICITKQFNYISQNYPNGDENLKLIDLNPITFDTIRLQQNANRAVNIDLVVFDGGLHGIQNSTYVKTTGFNKDLKGPHTVYIYYPKLIILGKYKVNGKILILPIQGEGDGNLTIVDMNLTARFDGKPLEKNGKIYLDVGKIKVKLQPKLFIVKLSNLFNDAALSENINKFANENWRDIYNELQDGMKAAISEQFLRKIFKSVFDNNPYDELFLPE